MKGKDRDEPSSRALDQAATYGRRFRGHAPLWSANTRSALLDYDLDRLRARGTN